MFLHGHIMHLAFNMMHYFCWLSALEQEIGTKKFIWVYVLAGIAASLSSLLLESVHDGVGASGAIFWALLIFCRFEFISKTHNKVVQVTPILINFGVFLINQSSFCQSTQADNAAHMGGW